MNRLFFRVLIIGTGLLFFLNIALAQEAKDKKTVRNVVSKSEISKMIDNFDIDNIDSTRFEMMPIIGGNLREYLVCLAAAKNDVSVCNHLDSNDANICVSNFNQVHIILRELGAKKQGGAKVDHAFSMLKDLTPGQKEKFRDAFINEDKTFCNEMNDEKAKNECMALVSRDSSYCFDSNCRDEVTYMKAVKKYNVSICNDIKNEFIKAICLADVSGDKNICKQCNDFKKFEAKYFNEANIKKQKGENYEK